MQLACIKFRHLSSLFLVLAALIGQSGFTEENASKYCEVCNSSRNLFENIGQMKTDVEGLAKLVSDSNSAPFPAEWNKTFHKYECPYGLWESEGTCYRASKFRTLPAQWNRSLTEWRCPVDFWQSEKSCYRLSHHDSVPPQWSKQMQQWQCPYGYWKSDDSCLKGE
jgi:hypothetical protein